MFLVFFLPSFFVGIWWVAVRRFMLTFLWLFLLFLLLLFFSCCLLQFLCQFDFAQLNQWRDILFFRFTTRAAHIQHNVLVGIDFDEIATLVRQVTGVTTFLASRSCRRFFGETRELGLHGTARETVRFRSKQHCNSRSAEVRHHPHVSRNNRKRGRGKNVTL